MSERKREPRACVGHTNCPYDENLVRELHAETAVQRTKIEGIEQGVQRIEQHLLGNGKPGLMTRMDRLEQKDKVRSRIVWLVFGIVATTVIGIIASTLGLVS